MKNAVFFRPARALALAALLLTGPTACVNDLDREPFTEVNTDTIYRDPANYIRVLAKLYAAFNLSGQQTTGAPDVSDLGDEGEASYFRAYWKLQQLPTDEAVVAWNNAPIQDLNKISWNSSNNYVRFAYNRIFYAVGLCNEFIRETTDAKLSSRGIDGPAADDARRYRAEARFLRALAYYHALDLFGRVPLVTEDQAPGKFQPRQASRAELFAYLEQELKDIESQLGAPRQPGYGHADQGAAWMLLATLYLNAEVYTGQDGTPGPARYTDCLTYCNKVLGAGYALAPEYRLLFLADNDQTAASEIIFPLTNDGTRQQTYGGTTYLVHAAVGGRMLGSAFGISNAWAGNRSRRNLPLLFPNPQGTTDRRAMFFTNGHGLETNDLIAFTDGYAVTKFKNKTSTGANGSDPTGTFVDTDFPLFRLADAMLTYAEAVVRGGQGGNQAQAIAYVNQLRQRAYGNANGNVTAAELAQPDFLLAERARELYWEAHRRTDLIRFGKFTSGTYLWPWKGGVRGGTGVAPTFNLYPLPATDLVANPGLVQNPGY